MKSRFSWLAYFLGVYSSLFSLMLLACIVADAAFNTFMPFYFYIIVTFFVILVWIWVIFGELRQKVISIEIGFDNIIIKRYLGLGPPTTFYFNQIDGFKTSVLPASAAEYEYLYLMMGYKKIAKLSQFYHKNYTDIKQMLISEKIKDLGNEDYNSTRELKEIFI